MEFGWKDTFSRDYIYSNNMNLEYYAVLYNLGVIYSLLGRACDLMDPDLEESKLKEGIKEFQYAAWIFDKIKQEVPNNIPAKQVSPDLSENNLYFVIIFRIIYYRTQASTLHSLNLIFWS